MFADGGSLTAPAAHTVFAGNPLNLGDVLLVPPQNLIITVARCLLVIVRISVTCGIQNTSKLNPELNTHDADRIYISYLIPFIHIT